VNRELIEAEGVRTGLGPPLGGAWAVCRFGLFLIDKRAPGPSPSAIWQACTGCVTGTRGERSSPVRTLAFGCSEQRKRQVTRE
jgi:hypothetical protein